ARLNQAGHTDGTPDGDIQPDAGNGNIAPDARATSPLPGTRTGDFPDPPNSGGTGQYWPAATPGDICDATIVPIVTGRVDHDLLDKLTAQLTNTSGEAPEGGAIRDLLLANAVALLSGPGQLASLLRTGTLGGPAASVSLPIDLGTSTETIP